MRNLLMRRQIDKKVKLFEQAKVKLKPVKGWISTIREALGLSKTQLAKGMGVTQPRVSNLEAAEVKDAVTLRSLRAAADAMDCELVYAIVPKTGSLEEIYLRQAKKVAKKRLARIQHSMALENQALEPKELQEQLNDLLDEILHESPRKMWKDT